MSTQYSNIDVDESEDAVSTTGCNVNWIHAVNLSTAVLFLKFYDATVADVVVGTTVPTMTFPVPAQSDGNGGGFTIDVDGAMSFDNALTIAATTGVAAADTGAPGANALVVNLGYLDKT